MLTKYNSQEINAPKLDTSKLYSGKTVYGLEGLVLYSDEGEFSECEAPTEIEITNTETVLCPNPELDICQVKFLFPTSI